MDENVEGIGSIYHECEAVDAQQVPGSEQGAPSCGEQCFQKRMCRMFLLQSLLNTALGSFSEERKNQFAASKQAGRQAGKQANKPFYFPCCLQLLEKEMRKYEEITFRGCATLSLVMVGVRSQERRERIVERGAAVLESSCQCSQSCQQPLLVPRFLSVVDISAKHGCVLEVRWVGALDAVPRLARIYVC
eukprot:s368_g7.t1